VAFQHPRNPASQHPSLPASQLIRSLTTMGPGLGSRSSTTPRQKNAALPASRQPGVREPTAERAPQGSHHTRHETAPCPRYTAAPCHRRERFGNAVAAASAPLRGTTAATACVLRRECGAEQQRRGHPHGATPPCRRLLRTFYTEAAGAVGAIGFVNPTCIGYIIQVGLTNPMAPIASTLRVE
jgi:hypothetical protein